MKIEKHLAIFIILLGILIRINVFFQNRSFIIDEANLARNIVEKENLDFFKPLDYDQYAPPLYSVLTKISTQVFGVNEYAMTLLSLLAGIGTLLLLWSFLKQFQLPKITVWYALLLYGFSELAIRYSTEFKQYAADAFLCLLFVWIAFRFKEKELNQRDILLWGIGGAIGIWASMPLIFVLAAIGFSFLYQSKKSVSSLLQLGFLGAIWLTSFALYFYLILYQDTKDREILNFHSRFFFSFTPNNSAEWLQNFNILKSLLRHTVDKTVIGNLWALLAFVIGFRFLFKTKRFELLLLILPVFLAIVASHFRLYSLIPRVALFIFPLLLIVVAVGHGIIWEKSKKQVKYLFAAIMILTLVNNEGYQYFYSNLEIENSKALLEILKKERLEKDLIYVQVDGMPAFTFYNQYHENAYRFENCFVGDVGDYLSPMFLETAERYTGDFWLFLSHTFPQSEIDRYVNTAKKVGVEKKRFLKENASLYYFEGLEK